MSKIVSTVLFLLSGWCVFFTALKSEEFANRYKLIEDPPLVGIEPQIIDVLTIGHRGLFDDFIDIWMLQILADPNLKNEDADTLYESIINILRQKPKIESSYMLPCFIFTLDFQRPELCEQITILGLETFPNSWRIPMTQGYVYAFKMNDSVKASAFYNLAASRPKSPEYVGRLAKKMLLKGGANPQTMQETLEIMMQVPGGSRFSSFVNETLKEKGKTKDK